MNALLYLIGEPGVGKSTVMRLLTDGLVREPLPGRPARDLLAAGERPVAVELGRRRGEFSGTDALPMAAVVDAERYLIDGRAAAETSLLLGEGARLANARFLSAAVAAGWRVQLGYLSAPAAAAERRAIRALQTGREQNPSWVRGAATRARRLAEEPPPGVAVTWCDGRARPRQIADELLALLPAPDLTAKGA